MKTHHKFISMALLSTFVLLGCQQDAQEQTASSPEIKQQKDLTLVESNLQKKSSVEFKAPYPVKDALKKQLDEIRVLTAMPEATKLSSCKVVGLGHKPCGGPERYILYSTEATDETVLLPLVEAYNQQSLKINEEEGLVSACDVIPKPSVALRNGACVPVAAETM